MNHLPTDDDLRTLPLRSIVAYGACAALRSRVCLTCDDIAADVDAAILTAVEFAGDLGFDPTLAACREERVAEAVHLAGNCVGDKTNVLVASAAYCAAHAAVLAAAVEFAPSPATAAAAVISAARSAGEAARAVDTLNRHALIRDFGQLVRRARASFPLLGRPVTVGEGSLGRVEKPVHAF